MSRKAFAGGAPRVLGSLCAGVLLGIMASPALAQYQVRHWANFEDGKLPDNVFTIGTEPGKTVQVVDLSTVANMPSRFHGEEASRELGRYALRLRSNPPDLSAPSQQTGLGLSFLLDRDQLPKNGRALFQADFYIPDEPLAPNLAVLAMDATDTESDATPAPMKSVSRPFYRFGITKGNVPYFSFFKPGDSKAARFQQDRALMAEIPKPGWHRFTMVADTSRTLECYVDGRGTIFSPYRDGNELRKLHIGVLLADPQRSYDCYVDNISIQVAEDNSPIPDSPWSSGWAIPAGLAALRNGQAPASNAERDTRWQEPVAAWQKAQETKRPLLLLFCSPGLPNSDRVELMFSKVPEASRLFSSHLVSRIDINQLQGGEVAKQYGVYRVPTLMVIAPDAKSYQKVTPAAHEGWGEIAAQLGL